MKIGVPDDIEGVGAPVCALDIAAGTAIAGNAASLAKTHVRLAIPSRGSGAALCVRTFHGGQSNAPSNVSGFKAYFDRKSRRLQLVQSRRVALGFEIVFLTSSAPGRSPCCVISAGIRTFAPLPSPGSS